MKEAQPERKTRFMNFRTTERRAEKLRRLANESDQTVSGVIDALIDNALIVPTQQVVRLVRVAGLDTPNKHETATDTLTGRGGGERVSG